MNTSHTREPITCAHCGHAIRENEPVIADLPGDVPEELSRAAFRHWHLKCNTGVSCYQAYASSQTAFEAQYATACAQCGDAIGQGELALRETFWVWTVPNDGEVGSEAAGTFVGLGQSLKNAGRPLSFKDLPSNLKQKFFTAGLGNGRGFRTYAEAQEFYLKSVPQSVRSMGPRAIRAYLRGKDASHIQSVANAPGRARLTSNVVWENHARNLRRGSANMSFKDRVVIRSSNKMSELKGVGKTALSNARRASIGATVAELAVSAAEGAVSVAKGKKTRERAAKDAAVNSVKAGLVGGGVAVGLTLVASTAAGPALAAATPVLVPLGVGMYGVSAYRRIKDAAMDNEPLQRMALYFHASCGEREDDVSCFEAFAAEVSESATDQGEAD